MVDHLTCAAWGALGPGEFKHLDCPVIVREAAQACAGKPPIPGPLPQVCPCECFTCKRAWWAAGRPILHADGSVTTGVIY